MAKDRAEGRQSLRFFNMRSFEELNAERKRSQSSRLDCQAPQCSVQAESRLDSRWQILNGLKLEMVWRAGRGSDRLTGQVCYLVSTGY